MARPANPNKEKIVELKSELKETHKLVRAGETAAKKAAKLAERLAKLTGDTAAAPVKKASKDTVKVKESSKSKDSSKEKVSKKDKKDSSKDKAKMQVVKKRGRPRKDEDEA